MVSTKLNLSFMVTPVANDSSKCIIATQVPGEYPQVINIDDLPVFTYEYFSKNRSSDEDK